MLSKPNTYLLSKRSQLLILPPPPIFQSVALALASSPAPILSVTGGGAGGGALAGPCVLESLAAAMGRLYFEIPCSGFLDERLISRSLASLAATGAWGLVTSAERLRPAVLSMLAKQLMELRDGVSSHSAFRFAGQTIRPRDGFGVVLTLPGAPAAAPPPLPEMLRWLTRRVALPATDRALELEAGLAFLGVSPAGEAARRVAAFFRLAPLHLPPQVCHVTVPIPCVRVPVPIPIWGGHVAAFFRLAPAPAAAGIC